MKFVPLYLHQNYEKGIVPLLKQLTFKDITIQQCFKLLKKLQQQLFGKKKQSYNNYKELKHIYSKNIPLLFNQISLQILNYDPKKYGKLQQIQILRSRKQKQINFNKKQIIYLLSLMTFNLIPLQQYEWTNQMSNNFPYCKDFKYIFDKQQFKTKTIIQYFRIYFQNKNQQKDQQQFTIQRKVFEGNILDIIDMYKDKKMMDYEIKGNQQSIEKFIGQGKVDFANKYIGGGALNSGNVQEQIMFVNHPQLFTTVLFCQKMNKNQALILIGYKKYFKNTGYGNTTKYDGEQKDIHYQIDNYHRIKQYIIAIDAINFKNNKYYNNQFTQQAINRQIQKAYTGFNIKEQINIATGNWGCGAFRGNITLKFLIQWIACSLVGKKMIYCPFGSKKLFDSNNKILQYLKKITIKQVYLLVINSSNYVKNQNVNLFQSIESFLHKNGKL